MRLVVIESPYAGDIERNMKYLALAVRDCLDRGETPYASHAFFTQFLDDSIPAERTLGIEAGLRWAACAEAAVFYLDHGMSEGMKYALARHKAEGRVIEERKIL